MYIFPVMVPHLKFWLQLPRAEAVVNDIKCNEDTRKMDDCQFPPPKKSSPRGALRKFTLENPICLVFGAQIYTSYSSLFILAWGSNLH